MRHSCNARNCRFNGVAGVRRRSRKRSKPRRRIARRLPTVGKTHLLQHVARLVTRRYTLLMLGVFSHWPTTEQERISHDVARAAQGSERGIVHIDGLIRCRLTALTERGCCCASGSTISRRSTASPLSAKRPARTTSPLISCRRHGCLGRLPCRSRVAGTGPRSEDSRHWSDGERRGGSQSDRRTGVGYVAADIVALWLHAVEAAVARDGAGGDPVVVSAAEIEADARSKRWYPWHSAEYRRHPSATSAVSTGQIASSSGPSTGRCEVRPFVSLATRVTLCSLRERRGQGKRCSREQSRRRATRTLSRSTGRN